MKKVLIVLAAALVTASAAQANGFYESRVLEPAASYVAKKPVKVWCAESITAWRAFVIAQNGGDNGEHGLADIPGAQTYFDQTVCKILRTRLRGVSVNDTSLAPSIEVLTHEAIHLRGERDEGVTDCAAVHTMPGVAVRFFHIRPGKQLRALMASAWAWRAELTPPFRTVC